MHEIHVLKNGDLFIFGTNFIKKNDKKLFWWKNKIFYDENSLNFQIINNKINVNLIEKKSNFHFTIVKSKNEMENVYLDVIFDNLIGNYKRYYGMMGYIGNQHYSLKNAVQDENITTMLINKSIVGVERKKRERGICWLVQLEHLLSKQKIQQFIKS